MTLIAEQKKYLALGVLRVMWKKGLADGTMLF